MTGTHRHTVVTGASTPESVARPPCGSGPPGWGVRVVLVEPASINSAARDKVVRDAEAVMAVASPSGRALYG